MICMKNLRFSSRPRAKFRRQGPPGSARAQPWFKIIRYLQGCLKCKTIVVSTFKPQCSTLTTGTCILDTRQWASMWNKSLAHKDKSLVKKKCGIQKFHDPLSLPNRNCLFLWQMQIWLSLNVAVWGYTSSFTVHFSFNELQPWVCFVQTWLKTSCGLCYRTSFTLHAVFGPLVNNNNLPRNHWPLKDSFSKKICQKKLEIFLIPALNLRKKIQGGGPMVALT